MRKLRLGVIGAGAWAVVSHLPNLEERRDVVEFVAVSRKGADMLEQIRDRFAFEIASEDYRDVINAGIDVCVVSSPGALHYEHARAALESGASVLIEKPITLDPEHAWELVRLADAKGLHLVCSFGFNFMDLLREAKALYGERGVGDVEQIAVRMFSYTRELLSNSGAYPRASAEALPEQATWTDPALAGGGYGQAQLSHALGVALWITGLRGRSAFATMSAPGDTPVELHDAVSLRFEGGAIGTLTGGSTHILPGTTEGELDVHVIGSDGQFTLEIAKGVVSLWRPDLQRTINAGPEAGVYECTGPPNALVDLALGQDVENCAPGELGARTVEVLAAAYRSAGTGAVADIAAGGGAIEAAIGE